MRNCIEYSELASALADGAISAEDANDLRDHAAVCPLCSREIHTLVAIKAASRLAISSVTCPLALRSRIISCINTASQQAARRPQRKRSWLLYSWAPTAAMAALLLVFILRPGMLPLEHLPKAAVKGPGYEGVFANPETAARHMAEETGLRLKGISLDRLGFTFVSAGATKVAGVDAAMFAFRDQAGNEVIVFQIAPRRLQVPTGRDISQYGLPARLIVCKNGCRVVYWLQNGLVVAVCTELPLEQSTTAGKIIAAQLQED